ncbi:MAG: hypothetical protein MI922_22035 [Bacteroidales bacterium]|nr:hypothetical protein [Bacteroidales bacterium]
MRVKITLLLLNFIFIIAHSQNHRINYQAVKLSLLNKIETSGKIFSSPVCTPDKYVVVGSHDKNVYFFDRVGNLVNKYATNGWIHASPSVISDSIVAIGSYDKNLYFFNTRGTLIEAVKTAGRIFTEVSQFSNGTLVYGLNKAIHFYNPLDEFYREIKLKRIIHGSPYIDGDSVVYIGGNDKTIYRLCNNGNILNKLSTKGWIMHAKAQKLSDGRIVYPCYDGNLYFLNSRGDLINTFQTNGSIHGNPIEMPDGTIVIGSMDKHIYLLDSDGNLKTKIKTGGRVVASPVQLNDHIFCVGSYDKNLYIINTDGEILTSYETGGKIFSSPIKIDKSTLAFGCNDKHMYFLKIEYL